MSIPKETEGQPNEEGNQRVSYYSERSFETERDKKKGYHKSGIKLETRIG